MIILTTKRYWLLPCLFTMGFSALAARVLYLYEHRDNFKQTIQKARQRTQVLQAHRGKILDRNGQCLVSNQQVYEVGVDLTQVQAQDLNQLPQLASLIKVPLNKLEEIWNCAPTCRWKKIKSDVPASSYEKICALKVKGIYGNERIKRIYIDTPSLGHIVGFVNHEGQPVCGIERSMHFYLNGQAGASTIEINGKFQEMAQFRPHSTPAAEGNNVEISLDAKNPVHRGKRARERLPTISSAIDTVLGQQSKIRRNLGIGHLPRIRPQSLRTLSHRKFKEQGGLRCL